MGSLSTASVLQNLYDSTDGKKNTSDLNDSNGNRIGGHLLYNDKLYTTVYIFYDNAPYQILSHLVSSTNLSTPNDTLGPYQVGTVGAGHVSGNMAHVPPEWQVALGGPALTGNCCLSITARTSVGPSASVFNPADLGVKNPAPATPVVDYSLDHPITNSQVGNSLYVQNDGIRGMVFPQNTASLLFFGNHGTGSVCYGNSGTDCYDPADPYKGYHTYPYKYQVWAYDANDLVKVKNGQLQPWQIQPYSVWNFNLPFETDDTHDIYGAAYDPATQKIFLSQHYKDGTLPIIHVFKVNATGGSAPPPTPTPTPITTGNTFYISPTGSDSNPGTSASPWKTFAFAIPKLNPGITLLLKDGTYSGPGTIIDINCNAGAQNGTAIAPITIKAENQRRALIQGAGNGNNVILVSSPCSYWIIDGLHAKDTDNQAGA